MTIYDKEKDSMYTKDNSLPETIRALIAIEERLNKLEIPPDDPHNLKALK